MTFNPTKPTAQANEGISVDYPSDRILLNGHSFDHVVFRNGFMEPVARGDLEAYMEVHVPLDDASFESNYQVDTKTKDEKLVEILVNEITNDCSLVCNEPSPSIAMQDRDQIDSS
jgi:hypothetical protein